MSVYCSQQQVITTYTSALECPICMETIEGLFNRVVTECGHTFHCSCLMQNVAHNGFGCPYCRTKMAEEPEEEENDEDSQNRRLTLEDLDDDEDTIFDEDTLVSFRMFQQRINGEEVEEEPAEEWESIDEDYEGEQVMPSADYVSQKLTERGITFKDLIKDILFQEHSNFGENYNEYARHSSEVYGQFRAIISQYTPVEQAAEAVAGAAAAGAAAAGAAAAGAGAIHYITPPYIAETKSVGILYFQNEFMSQT